MSPEGDRFLWAFNFTQESIALGRVMASFLYRVAGETELEILRDLGTFTFKNFKVHFYIEFFGDLISHKQNIPRK